MLEMRIREPRHEYALQLAVHRIPDLFVVEMNMFGHQKKACYELRLRTRNGYKILAGMSVGHANSLSQLKGIEHDFMVQTILNYLQTKHAPVAA